MTEEEFNQLNVFINDLLYNKMTIDDYYYIMNKMDARNNRQNRFPSICHELHSNKFNLSFDEETRCFYCFSECNCSYSLLNLIKKNRELCGENSKTIPSLKWLCNELNIEFNFKEEAGKSNTDKYNWKSTLLKYLKKNDKENSLPLYDKSVLNFFPKIYHENWLDYGISIETMEKYNIRYYPYRDQIVIPCYDKDGNLCGIRIRNMNQNVLDSGSSKYLPLQMLDGTQYKFPTNLCFYGENFNSENCQRTKSVILSEGEKSVLKHESWFGSNNNICLGMYGSNLGNEKLKKLVSWGIETYYISLDSDFETIYEDEENGILSKDYIKFEEKVMKIAKEIRPYAKKIYVIYNNVNLKNFYKCNMYDGTLEQFHLLWNNKEEVVFNE